MMNAVIKVAHVLPTNNRLWGMQPLGTVYPKISQKNYLSLLVYQLRARLE